MRQALANGFVDPTDELLSTDAGEWRPVREVLGAGAKSWRWKEHFHWYVLAAVLVGMYLLGFGVLWMLLAVGSHALWRATMRKGPRSRMRWW